MTPQQLLKTLQLNDTLFPTGGFAYSDGLETAITNGRVRDAASLEEWLVHYVVSTFVCCDGLAVRLAMEAHARGDWAALAKLDTELTALKPAASLRASSATQGRSFLKSTSAFHGHPDILRVGQELVNLPIVYAVVFSTLGIDVPCTLLGFAYARLAGMISSALRAMPIGQQQGQTVLDHAMQRIPLTVEGIMMATSSELTSFAPILDIQQMNHRSLYSRLFRS